MSIIVNRQHAKAKILVVDDRKENLFAMEKILRTLDCEIFMAYSGNEALSHTLRHDFALILLDVNMPEMDGFELAEILRSTEETKQIPIIFVTATDKEDKSVFKGYESGAVDYLFKPVDVDILLSKVKVFLELNLKKKELEAISRELERSNQSLMEFAQVVSHDLKNPLHVIMGFSEIIMTKHSDGMTERGKESMKQIVGAAERMSRLITDLLDYAQANAQQAYFGTVDLNEVMADVSADLGNRLEASGGRVNVLAPLPVIEADPTQMYQLFQNLIANGIKYCPADRRPEIVISAVEAAAGMCGIRVEDNGIGMDMNDVPHIFDPFKRLAGAKGYEGTGLGLATVKKIVELHRGTIEVTSRVGEGTAFLVLLHLKPAARTQSI